MDFLISYDGRCGDREYGEELPVELGLRKIMLRAGLSSQSLLLGKKEVTYEALYVSRGLLSHFSEPRKRVQLSLFEPAMA